MSAGGLVSSISYESTKEFKEQLHELSLRYISHTVVNDLLTIFVNINADWMRAALLGTYLIRSALCCHAWKQN